jgi:glyoxylase-like metal-dependent hydrolase (beta-lactamase superfamily II)
MSFRRKDRRILPLPPQILPADTSWFSRTEVDADLSAYTEPFLNAIFRANFYHLRGRDLDLVIDTGMGLAPVLPVLDLTRGKPLLAVATHIHADHVGSLHEFADRAGPQAEADAFATMDDLVTFADEFRTMNEPVSALPHAGWRARHYVIQAAPLTRILAEGDTIELGNRCFTVIELPGHSPGCIGLFDERDGTLFSGDAIYEGRLYDDLRCSDRAAYRDTMRRLIGLPVRRVHGGHGSSLDAEEMHAIARNYLEHG